MPRLNKGGGGKMHLNTYEFINRQGNCNLHISGKPRLIIELPLMHTSTILYSYHPVKRKRPAELCCTLVENLRSDHLKLLRYHHSSPNIQI